MSDFGTLILNRPDGVSQEFILNKSLVTLGRATTNDIVLVEARASRNHAQLSCSLDGLTLIDLNSANGVWQNGARITEAKIKPGETFEIGGCVLQFLAAAPDTQPEATLINTEGELELTLNQMTVPI
jgi:pSer/pThr/pTyr-binding forkhead associated (FHA) protein